MNNKHTLVAISAMVLIGLIVVVGILFANRGVAVTVTFLGGVDSLTIDNQEVQNQQTIRLEPGKYIYSLNGENIASTRHETIITSNTSKLDITYAPYSSQHLASLLPAEQARVTQVINKGPLTKQPDYAISKVQLFDRGQYAGVLLTPVDSDRSNPSGGLFRALVQKQTDTDTWKLVSTPQPLLTKFNTPDAKIEILTAVNDLSI